MRAIDERIEVKAARRVKQLLQTVFANRGVGADPGLDRPGASRFNGEARFAS